jgi:two-component system chemotaxis sensor kinase CheA
MGAGGAQHEAGLDLSPFRQAFVEEACENLESMEQMLLNLDPGSADREQLDAIFRCAHSVKGGAAAFGLSDVAELTHEMETLLDKLRRGERAPSDAVVDALLASGDALRTMLARHPDHAAAPIDTRALLATIRRLVDGWTPRAPVAPAAPCAAERAAASAAQPAPASGDAASARAGVPGRAGAKGAGSPVSGTLRVSVEKVDRLVNLVGELVVTQALLAQRGKNIDGAQDRRLASGLTDLERTTRNLREAVMSMRMVPMSQVFDRFPRMLRDLAGKLGKKVELVQVGEATELDRGLVEKITDPLTHLVRNSCDHGIERPAERTAKGKPETGTITLVARRQGGSIVIEVRDDGRGLNRAKLLAKARERGLDARGAMSDQEVYGLIFAAGFSTAEQVTEVSGRGVGMDVVKKNVTSLGGTVEIDSAEGAGMTVRLRLPLTLAVQDGMSVSVGEMLGLPVLGRHDPVAGRRREGDSEAS